MLQTIEAGRIRQTRTKVCHKCISNSRIAPDDRQGKQKVQYDGAATIPQSPIPSAFAISQGPKAALGNVSNNLGTCIEI